MSTICCDGKQCVEKFWRKKCGKKCWENKIQLCVKLNEIAFVNMKFIWNFGNLIPEFEILEFILKFNVLIAQSSIPEVQSLVYCLGTGRISNAGHQILAMLGKLIKFNVNVK